MLDDFVVRALLAGVGVALAAAPLGCFIVWRRMAYFGDATAHAAILGVAFSLAFSISITVGVLAVALGSSLLLNLLSGRGYAMDTLLGVLAHSSLAAGLVAVSFIDGVRLDLSAYLFGDILAVNRTDLVIIGVGGSIVVGLICWRWSALLTTTLNPDLARASGLNPDRESLILTLALALVVAIAIKVVGALLITAMLIIPAAAARPLSKTPEAMAWTAAGLGVLAVFGGIEASLLWDTPAGPTIVCAAALLFVLTNLVGFLAVKR